MINMLKMKNSSKILILAFVFLHTLLHVINIDNYIIVLNNLTSFKLSAATSFLYSNMGTFNPFVLLPRFLGIEYSLYLEILTLIIVGGLAFLYHKVFIENEKDWRKTTVLLAFVLLSTSFLYRVYAVLFMPFMLLSFYFLKDLIYRKKIYPITITMTLLLISNWIFGIATFLVLMMLLIYYIEDDIKYGIKDMFRLLISFLIAFGLSSIIIFPSLQVGTVMPSAFFPVSLSVLLIHLMLGVRLIKMRRKLISTILGFIYLLLFLKIEAMLLLVMIPYVFVLLKEFLNHHKLDNREVVIFILFYLLLFGLAFDKAVIYPIIVSNEKMSSFFEATKTTSFLALTALIATSYIEFNTRKLLSKKK